MRQFLTVIVSLIIVAALAYGEETYFKVLTVEKGVTVSVHEDPTSNALEIKGEIVLEGSPQEVIDILNDAKRSKEWIKALNEKRVLKNYGESDRTVYTEVDMPWPVTDRFFITRSSMRAIGNSIVIESRQDKTQKIEDNGLVEGIVEKMRIRLEPVGETGKTKVVLVTKTDPKGNLPRWIVRWVQKSAPVNFLTGLQEQILKVRNEAVTPAIKPAD